MRMYLYALSYLSPYDEKQPFVLFVASERQLDEIELKANAIETVGEDSLGNEWIEAVAHGVVCGPLEVAGTLRQPTIAVVVE